jgi:tRNA(Arg) A34 adenosine deaminase TadA
METVDLLNRLLDVIEREIAPKTRIGVTHGNKLFGAAILRKSDLSIVIAETNNETENPLWHGEIHAIKRFYELPQSQRPDPKDCLFLATHEPTPTPCRSSHMGGMPCCVAGSCARAGSSACTISVAR